LASLIRIAAMTAGSSDVWDVMATAPTIRRFYGMSRPAADGPVRRRPVSDVVSYDRWDEPGDDGL